MAHFSRLLGTLVVVITGVYASVSMKQRASGEGATAVYFQTNRSPNSIVAVPVNAEGHLGQPTFHSTRADGEEELGANGPNPRDSLGSENSVVVAGNFLFNVNSGSRSVSLFSIPAENPTSLNLVGSYPTNGNGNGAFPNTLTVQNGLICVGFGGSPAGVSCATWNSHGINHFDGLRPLDLGQTNPPSTSNGLMSQVYFTGDGSWLVANVRAGASTPSVIARYRVTGGGVSDRGDLFLPQGLNTPFGTGMASGSSLAFISDPSIGGVTIDLNTPDRLVSSSVVPGQSASCWARVKPGSTSGILADAGLNRIVEVDLLSGHVLQEFNSTNGLIGNFDFAIDNTNKVFTSSFSNTDALFHVSVFDASGTISDVDSSAIEGTDVFCHGMAVYPA